jgi:hypothetical protein
LKYCNIILWYKYVLVYNAFLFLMCQLKILFAERQAPPPAPAQSGGGSILGGIGSTIAQGWYRQLVLFGSTYIVLKISS